jgi:hypothetical protein
MLQVSIGDYPYPQSFPSGYFYSILKPGMRIEEVHKIIRGYEKVYKCSEGEYYYYYSQEDDKAARFFITYDSNGLFKQIEGEDDNSRTFFISKECLEGD